MKWQTPELSRAELTYEIKEDLLSLKLITPFRSHLHKFFLEMIHKWLFPGKKIKIPLFFLREVEESLLIQVDMELSDVWDREKFFNNWAAFKHEVEIGALSSYQANQILEMKGLSGSEKRGYLQEGIGRLVQRFPSLYDYDIFSTMQHILINFDENFLHTHEVQYLKKLVTTLYLLKKQLCGAIVMAPQKRHFFLKLMPGKLQHPFGVKKILGICIGINFLREHEILAKRHLIKVVQTFIPETFALDKTYYSYESEEEKVHLIYLEFEKEHGEAFSTLEMVLLEKRLPIHLKRRIEHLQRSLFMPRNEEEVMRNVITLGQQLRYVNDLPQMVITFDHQTETHLLFTVILVRLIKSSSKPIADHFEESRLLYEIDRIRVVGILRKKYPKEATVFKLGIPIDPFIREDHSVDLYKGREALKNEIQRIVGEVRDYNGGMIIKQNELFLSLKDLLGDAAFSHHFLLENFFHALYPIEQRSIVHPTHLKTLFHMLLDMIKEGMHGALKTQNNDEGLFAMMTFEDRKKGEKVHSEVKNWEIPMREVLSLQMYLDDHFFLGYLYLSKNEKDQCFFQKKIEDLLGNNYETCYE